MWEEGDIFSKIMILPNISVINFEVCIIFHSLEMKQKECQHLMQSIQSVVGPGMMPRLPGSPVSSHLLENNYKLLCSGKRGCQFSSKLCLRQHQYSSQLRGTSSSRVQLIQECWEITWALYEVYSLLCCKGVKVYNGNCIKSHISFTQMYQNNI